MPLRSTCPVWIVISPGRPSMRGLHRGGSVTLNPPLRNRLLDTRCAIEIRRRQRRRPAGCSTCRCLVPTPPVVAHPGTRKERLITLRPLTGRFTTCLVSMVLERVLEIGLNQRVLSPAATCDGLRAGSDLERGGDAGGSCGLHLYGFEDLGSGTLVAVTVN